MTRIHLRLWAALLIGLSAPFLSALSSAEEAIPWATPLRGGSLRTLAVVPHAARPDVDTLALHLDMKVTVCTLWSADAAEREDQESKGNAPVEAKGRKKKRQEATTALGGLREALKKEYDLILLGRFRTTTLPSDIQGSIADQVHNGAGLVTAWLERGDPQEPLVTLLEALDNSAAQDVCRGLGGLSIYGITDAGVPDVSGQRRLIDGVRAGTCGQGRVVECSFPGDPPQTHAFIPTASEFKVAPFNRTENAYALVTRAAVWACGRSPRTRIAGLRDMSPKAPSAEEIPPDLPKEYTDAMRQSAIAHPLRPFVLALESPADTTYTVQIEVRKPESDMRNAYPGDRPLKKGEQYWPFDLLVGPGNYLVDVWLKDGKGVADWFSSEVSIVAWPNFTDLRLTKESVLSNDAVGIQLRVPPIFNQHRACTLYVRAVDPTMVSAAPTVSPAAVQPRTVTLHGGIGGRCVAEALTEVGNEGGDVEIALGVADLLSPMLKIEIFATEGSKHPLAPWELNNAYYECRYVPVRTRPSMPSFTASVSLPLLDEPNIHRLLGRLRGMGVDSVHAPGGQVALWNAAWQGLGFVPELSRTPNGGIAEGLIRHPCLSDPAVRQLEGKQLQTMTAWHLSGSSGNYSLGERALLATGSVNACQSETCLAGFRAWVQTEYGTVQRLNDAWGSGFNAWVDVVPPDPAIAAEAQCFAGFVDFRQYMDSVFAAFLSYGRDCVHQTDPQARAGFGLLDETGVYSGYAWRRLAAAADFVTAPPEIPWIEKWRSFRKESGTYSLIFDEHAQTTAPQGRALTWQAALRGAGGIHCTHPFALAGVNTPETALQADGAPTPAFAATMGVVEELKRGLGILLSQARRVPATIAIYDSPSSHLVNAMDTRYGVDSLRADQRWIAWLEQAGLAYDFVGSTELSAGLNKQYRVLVLPMVRAMSNEETQALQAFHDAGGLVAADIAPAVWGGHGEHRAAPALDTLFGIQRNGTPETVVIPNSGDSTLRSDRSVAAQGAQPQSTDMDVPINLKGTGTFLLNYPVPTPPESASTMEPLRTWIQEAGVEPMFAVDGHGKSEFHGQRFLLEYRGARIAALLADAAAGDKPQKVQLNLGKDAVVYDLRQGLKVTRSDKIERILQAGDALCFSILPEDPQPVLLTLSGEAFAGKRLEVQVAVPGKDGKAQARLLTLGLEDPAHRPMLHYRQYLESQSGMAKTFFPLAFNEIPGGYQVTVRDVLTGQEVRKRVFVGGRLQ